MITPLTKEEMHEEQDTLAAIDNDKLNPIQEMGFRKAEHQQAAANTSNKIPSSASDQTTSNPEALK